MHFTDAPTVAMEQSYIYAAEPVTGKRDNQYMKHGRLKYRPLRQECAGMHAILTSIRIYVLLSILITVQTIIYILVVQYRLRRKS